jgi:exodeoxyribonuclease VII large subunit
MTDFASPPDRRILSVRQLNETIRDALQTAFPEPLWVRGEVQRLPADAARRQHVYFELHDAGAKGQASHQIPASLMGWDRQRFGLGRYLDGSDPAFRLQDKLEVCLLCNVDFYPPFGKLSVKVVGVDPEFSLGKLEAQRRRVLAWLEQEQLLRLNATRQLAELPLRVGLITSAGSAAETDFRTGLDGSGYPFAVTLADCRMMGEQTAPQVIAALQHLGQQDLDVIVITRGGGSRADLSWFDQQDLCVAVARCPLPVVAAIGHEIDTSLVDMCAHTRCKTPTAAAELLVERVAVLDRRLRQATADLRDAAVDRLGVAHRDVEVGDRVARLVRGVLRAADGRLRAAAGALESRTGRAVARWQHRLGRDALRLSGAAQRRAERDRRRTDGLAERLVRESGRYGRDRARRLDALAEKVRLLDPARLLERGYTMTLDRSGAPLTRAAGIAPGQTLRTRFRDGEIESIVTAGGKAPARKGGRRGGEEDPGQQALF